MVKFDKSAKIATLSAYPAKTTIGMKKTLLGVILAFLLLTIVTSPAQASLKQISVWDECKETLDSYLSKIHSPLSPYAGSFAKAAQRNDLECALLPAISGVESGFGKAIPKGSFNAFGWDNGRYMFKDWDQAINIVGDTLGQKYVKRWGARTPEQIGRYYAADPNWSKKVRLHMSRIQTHTSI